MVAVSKTHHKHNPVALSLTLSLPRGGWWTKGGCPNTKAKPSIDAGRRVPVVPEHRRRSKNHLVTDPKPDPTPHTRRRGCMNERWTPAGRTEASFSYHTRGCTSLATRNAAPMPGTIPWACEPNIVDKIAGAILRRSPLLSIWDPGRKGRRGTKAANVHPIPLG